MKIIDTPRTGALGRVVAFQSRFGLCLRERISPRNIRTPARQFMRGAFGHHSQVYSHKLSDEQLDRWSLAAARVMSEPTLGQSGVLSPQQLYTAINSVRSRVNLPETWDPPAPVAFGPSAVGELVIENTEAGVRLLLRISGDLNEDVMVFGQEPCSSGRRKRRNVAYLGLLPPPVGGLSDITYLYQARYGQPRPGTRVFIVTCQEKGGWKGIDQETSALVPDRPKGQEAVGESNELNGLQRLHGVGAETISAASLNASEVREPAGTENSQIPLMHKGSTRDAEGIVPPVDSQSPEGAETGIGGGKAAGAAIGGGGGGGSAGVLGARAGS